MQFVYNDGGRQEAGYKGKTRDCVCRAIAIATEQPYEEIYKKLNELISASKQSKAKKKSNSRTGICKKYYHIFLINSGWKWVPCMKIGTGCQTHLRAEELPTGRLIIRLSRHLTTVIDGVLNDTYNCSRDEKRCVYGYYKKDN